MNIQDELIDSVRYSITTGIIMNDDNLDDAFAEAIRQHTASSDVEFLKNHFKDDKEQLFDLVNGITDDDILDDIICGNAEYWRDEFNIYNIKEYIKDDLLQIGRQEALKQLGLI